MVQIQRQPKLEEIRAALRDGHLGIAVTIARGIGLTAPEALPFRGLVLSLIEDSLGEDVRFKQTRVYTAMEAVDTFFIDPKLMEPFTSIIRQEVRELAESGLYDAAGFVEYIFKPK